MSETVSFESGRHPLGVLTVVECLLELGWGNVPQMLEKALLVEPVYPVQRGQFDGFYAAPRALSPYQVRLVEADDGSGQCVVVAAADAPD